MFWLSLAAFVLSACSVVADCQQIRGAIVDVTGSLIGNASIRLLSGSNVVAIATADDTGKFQMNAVDSGTYILRASG